MGRTARRRKNKKLALLYDQRESQSELLPVESPVETLNLAGKLTEAEHGEIIDLFSNRYEYAQPQTDAMRQRMEDWEKMYEAEYIHKVADGVIYFPKAREFFEVIHAYIMNLVQQLNPLLETRPIPRSLVSLDEDFKKAKLLEAMLLHYFDDIWHFRTTILPDWLKTFMKHPVGIFKLAYVENDFYPSLKLEVKDRGNLYVDPAAKDIRDCRWVIERYWLPISEVQRRMESGIWQSRWGKDDYFYQHLTRSNGGTNSQTDEILERTMTGGSQTLHPSNREEDDLVECYDYWQSPGYGMSSVYLCVVGGVTGGEIVWYGENPFPYKGIPYRGKSYDPHEYKIDGQSFMQKQEELQELINNIYNLRLQDIRENITSPVFIPEELINSQTQEDFKNGSKFVRLDKTAIHGLLNKNMRLSDVVYPLPITTSTQELLQDFQMAMGQSQQSSQVSEVFRGQSPNVQATLGQVNEQIVRSQGVFKPVVTQVMRIVEELAEIMIEYFKSEDFFPDRRIITMLGVSRYQKWLPEIKRLRDSNMFAVEVDADKLDVDVSIVAISGADAHMQRSMTVSNINNLLAVVSTNPDLYNDAKKKINFSSLVSEMIKNTLTDYDQHVYTAEEQQQMAQQEAQQQQQATQQQIELQAQNIRFMEQAKAEAERIKQQSRAEAEIAINRDKTGSKLESDLAINNIQNKHALDVVKETQRSKLEADIIRQMDDLQQTLILMREEAKLEKANNVSIGSHRS